MQERVWDAGLGVSALCLVHCLALPVAAASLPALGFVAEAEWMHWSLLAIAAPPALFALRARHGHAGSRLVLGAAAVGLSLMLAGAFELPSHEWGEALTLAGVLSLSLAHLLNWRSRHAHRAAATICCCTDHDQPLRPLVE